MVSSAPDSVSTAELMEPCPVLELDEQLDLSDNDTADLLNEKPMGQTDMVRRIWDGKKIIMLLVFRNWKEILVKKY